ncbi:LCP family protein [Rhodococcoides trifolii]|uniref:LCP family protein n=1 Tax=Rhodococcoides trifolii TaxID=908250 RepID=UPI00353047A0
MPTPRRPAPWERRISHVAPDSRQPTPRPPSPRPPVAAPPAEAPAPPEPDRPPPAPARKFGIRGRRQAPETTGRVSVAELVDQIGQLSRTTDDEPTRSSPPDIDSHPGEDAPTTRLPAVDAAPVSPTTPPPTTPPPTTPPPNPPAVERPHAEPEAVGPVAPPTLTRLALNRARKRKRARMAGRVLVSFVAVMALVLTGVVWAYLRSTDQGFSQVAALDPDSTDVVDAPGQYGDETYLIVGTDTRAGASGEVGAGSVADAEGARSDTVMLVNIPADRSRVVAVSFPRDLDVERPECEGWDSNTGDYTGEMYEAADGDKLNATYALGGPKCLVKVIQKMSGLKISHFVGMDFAGFESMVNEVGGVDVCTTTPLIDDELGTVLANPGTQLINGATALNYVRARKVEAEGTGDYGRIKRQQLFLSSLLRSVLSNKVLFDPGKLNGFVTAFTRDTFVENVKTADLLTLGKSLRDVDAGAVTFLTVPTAGTTDYGNEIPRMSDITAIFTAIINDQPLPGESRSITGPTTPTTPPPAPVLSLAVDPSTVSVQVSNGSEMSGLAATTADGLASYGFQIVGTGNADSTSAQTVVRYAAGQESEAATVASGLPGSLLEETASLGGIIEVVVGSDFAGTVVAPTPLGTQLPAIGTTSTLPVTDVALPADLTVTNAADDTCA